MEEKDVSFLEKFLMKFLFDSKKYIWGLALPLALFSLYLVGMAKKSSSSCEEYKKFKALFAKWENAPADVALLEKVHLFLQKEKAFLSHYEPLVAQGWVSHHSLDRALPYVERSLKYLQRESPEHAFFSETTLLIEKGFYQEALEKSIRLKEQMGKEESYLYFQNLLRIASLQKEIKNGPGEEASWRDVENFLGWKDGLKPSPFADQIVAFYQEHNINLKEYLKNQEETFAKKL